MLICSFVCVYYCVCVHVQCLHPIDTSISMIHFFVSCNLYSIGIKNIKINIKIEHTKSTISNAAGSIDTVINGMISHCSKSQKTKTEALMKCHSGINLQN